jgi:hypothetical protein
VHQQLVPARGGEHRDLGRADDVALADGDVAGLDVLPHAAHEAGRRHAAADREARGAAVGPPQRCDGVGEGRQRRPRRDADGLAGLQPQRLTRPGGDLAHHRDGDRGGVGGPGHVDAAHRVAVDRGLVEDRQRTRRDDLLRAAQPLRVGDRDAHRGRTHRHVQDAGQVIGDRAHAQSFSRSFSQVRRSSPYSGCCSMKST